MKSLHILAIASLVSVGMGLAVSTLPAAAAEHLAECQNSDLATNVPGESDVSQIDLAKANIMEELKAKGVDATDISDWGGCIRAEVKKADGTTVFKYFDPNSLDAIKRK